MRRGVEAVDDGDGGILRNRKEQNYPEGTFLLRHFVASVTALREF